MQIIDISPPNLLFPMAVNGNSSFQLLRPNSRVILDVSIFFLSHSIQQQILLSSSSKFTKNTTNSNYTTFTTLVIFHRLYLLQQPPKWFSMPFLLLSSVAFWHSSPSIQVKTSVSFDHSSKIFPSLPSKILRHNNHLQGST